MTSTKEKKKTKVLFFEERELFGEALSALFDKTSLKILPSASSSEDCLKKIQQYGPDVLILGIHTVNPAPVKEFILNVKKSFPELKLLLLSSVFHSQHPEQFFELHFLADGSIPWGWKSKNLNKAVAHLLKGKFIFPRALADFYATMMKQNLNKETQQKTGFTARESEVVRLLIEGRTNKEIAGQLGVSEKTIKNQLVGLYAKFGVSNRSQMVAKALREYAL